MGRCAQSVRRVGHHIAGGHGVDGDQQVGIDRQTERPVDSGSRVQRPRTHGEFGCGKQRVEPAATAQRDREVIVHQADRRGAAGHSRCQPWFVGQWPEHRHRDGPGGVGGDHIGERVDLSGLGVAGYAGDRQQEAGLVEAGDLAVLRGAVDVDQQGVDPGFLDAERRLTRRADRHRELKASRLSAIQLACDADEFTDPLEPSADREAGAQRRGRGQSRAVLEACQHIADRAVAGVGHRGGHRDRRVAGGGHYIGGDAVQADGQQWRGLGVGPGARLDQRQGQQCECRENARQSLRHAQPAGPQPFERRLRVWE